MADIYLLEIASGSDVVLAGPGIAKVAVAADFAQTFAIAPPKVAVVVDYAQSFSIDGTGAIDIPTIPASRRVAFDGGVRVVRFEGSIRAVVFQGGTRTVRF